MSEMFDSSLTRLLDMAENLLTRPPTEQTRECTEAASSLQSTFAPSQKKAGHYVPITEDKRKKRRIPFVALALLLAFDSRSCCYKNA